MSDSSHSRSLPLSFSFGAFSNLLPRHLALKSSRYNVWIEKDGDCLLFNTLYGSISVMENGDRVDAISLLNGSSPSNRNRMLWEQLVEQKHIVAETTDELGILRHRKHAGICDKNTLHVILMPTLNCNFRCLYCYEEHKPTRMDGQVVEALKMWLESEIPLHKVTMLHWFGGEPLLEYRHVLEISRHVRDTARDSGALVILHMTTNGYLLSARRARELTEAGLRDFQITLDGPQKQHDAFRVLSSGLGTFKKIFENVCLLARTDRNVRITLRVNFNQTNLQSIPELLEAFPVQIRPQLRVAFEPIFGDSAMSAVRNIPGSVLSEHLAEYSESAKSLGYDVIFGLSAVHPGKLVYCYAEREHQYIVGPDGNVYKCSVCDFDETDKVGWLGPDGTIHKDDKKWAKWIGDDLFAKECVTCVYLPLCMGGCRRARMQPDRSDDCSLVATNASYLLKQIAFGQLGNAFTGCAEEAMKVIAKPVSEKQVLESTQKKTTPEKIHAGMVAKAECCVDHLCGCRK